MELTSGTDTMLNLKQNYNRQCIELLPIGGNIRYIDLTRKDKNEMALWTVRTAEETLNLTATPNDFSFTCTEVDKLRLGETLELFDTNDTYLGAGVITKIEGNNVTYIPGGETDYDFGFDTSNNVAKCVLRKDPVLLDEHSKPVTTNYCPFLIVQADADLELSISMLHTGLDL